MSKIRYVKLNTKETEDGKIIKLGFSGSFEGLIYKVTAEGNAENIGNFVRENKLDFFGQTLDFELKNTQTGLTDFEERKEEWK